MWHWLKYRMRCKLGFHLWSYGGYRVPCSDGSHCIIGYRVCIFCVPYVRERWLSGWEGRGKARWIKLSAEEFMNKKPQENKE